MKKLILIICCVLSVKAVAQKKDTVKYFVDVNLKQVSEDKATTVYKVYQSDAKSWIFSTYNINDVIQQKETYLDSLLTTKQGSYVEYKFGKTSLKGSYLNNMRHGNFVEYDTAGVVREVSLYNLDTLKTVAIYYLNGGKREEKIYSAKNQVAERLVYYENGNLAIKQIFSPENKIIEGTYLDIDGKVVKISEIESAPIYPGGIQRFYEYIARNVKYPLDAAKDNIEGSVLISYVISVTGKVTDVKVIKGIYPSLDNEAVRVMNTSPKWTPAIFFGKNVRVNYTMPIKFSLSGNY